MHKKILTATYKEKIIMELGCNDITWTELAEDKSSGPGCSSDGQELFMFLHYRIYLEQVNNSSHKTCTKELVDV
jgi:hypothetical protein